MRTTAFIGPGSAAAGFLAQAIAAHAQPEGFGELPRWSPGVAAIVAHQSPADIDGGGTVAVTRYAADVRLARIGRDFTTVSLGFSVGGADYSFGGGVPAVWEDIETRSVSLSLLTRLGDRATLIVAPSYRTSAERGADIGEADTYGGIAALFWRFSDSFTIGPGLGVFSKLDGDTQVFPFLAIDWDITERLKLSTGQGVGATQGPGLSLSYALTDALRLGAAARIESAEFRLDDDGLAPGGIGQHDSFPVVATLSWDPNPGTSLSAFAGMEYGGELTLLDAQGGLISRNDYDPAPVFGGQVSLRF